MEIHIELQIDFRVYLGFQNIFFNNYYKILLTRKSID